MSSSNSITSEKKSAPKMQRSKSFSEEHKPFTTEERGIHKSKSLPKEHVVDITSVSVFRVPKAVTETKPEAYAPRKLGLGPFHHFRPDLYTMQRKKFDEVVDFVNSDVKEGLNNIKLVLRRLAELRHVIIGSYSESVDRYVRVLLRVISTDAIYLLNFLRKRKDTNTDLTDPETEKILAGDIWMLENQIPGDLVIEIWKILKLGEESVLSRNIRDFCEKESPLKLTEKPEDVLPFLKNGHLLNVLYNLILQRETTTYRSLNREITISDNDRKELIRKEMLIYGAAKFSSSNEFDKGPNSNRKPDASAAAAPPFPVDFAGLPDAVSSVHQQGGVIMRKELSILQKMIPWGLFINKLKDIDPDREENISPVKEIQIPSVSRLKKYAGIRFKACIEKGIKNIKFDEKEKTLYLPPLTLTSNTEVILRNLLAYEAAITKPRSRLEFAEYVDLMCGIIDTRDDVRILREAKIIGGDLRSTEIADIFNGIWRSTGDEEEEEESSNIGVAIKESSNIGVAIKEVKEFYGSRSNVRIQRFIHRHIFKSWKLLAVVSSVMALMLLALQAFCEIYDCNKHWFGGGKYDISRLFDQVGSFSSM